MKWQCLVFLQLTSGDKTRCQEGISSPDLFNRRADALLERMHKSSFGYHVGATNVGAVTFSDDLALKQRIGCRCNL